MPSNHPASVVVADSDKEDEEVQALINVESGKELCGEGEVPHQVCRRGRQIFLTIAAVMAICVIAGLSSAHTQVMVKPSSNEMLANAIVVSGREYVHLAPKGSDFCDYGQSVGKDDCVKYATMMAGEAGKSLGRNGALQQGSGGACLDGGWGQVPGGCSVQSGGDWAAHFKSGSIPNVGNLPGKCTARAYQLVCRGKPPPNDHTSKYHLAPPGSASCDYGKPVHERECLAAVNSLRQYEGVPAPQASRARLQSGSGGTCMDGGWGQVPHSCSAQSGGDWAAHYKSGNTEKGCVHSAYQLVCEKWPFYQFKANAWCSNAIRLSAVGTKVTYLEKCAAAVAADPACSQTFQSGAPTPGKGGVYSDMEYCECVPKGQECEVTHAVVRPGPKPTCTWWHEIAGSTCRYHQQYIYKIGSVPREHLAPGGSDICDYGSTVADFLDADYNQNFQVYGDISGEFCLRAAQRLVKQQGGALGRGGVLQQLPLATLQATKLGCNDGGWGSVPLGCSVAPDWGVHFRGATRDLTGSTNRPTFDDFWMPGVLDDDGKETRNGCAGGGYQLICFDRMQMDTYGNLEFESHRAENYRRYYGEDYH